MIARLKQMLIGRERQNSDTTADEETLKLATAALLMEAACMDGHADQAELDTIADLLTFHFDLETGEARDLVTAGKQAVQDSVELYGFTRIIKDSFNHDDRVKMIEMLWTVAYADGVLHDFEANLVRRVSGLIYVPDRENGEARKRVLERLDLPPSDVS